MTPRSAGWETVQRHWKLGLPQAVFSSSIVRPSRKWERRGAPLV